MMMMMKLQTDTYGNRNAQSLLPWQQFRLQRPSAAARCCENSRRSFQSYKTLFGATNSIELVLPSCRYTRRWKKNNIKKRKNGKIHFRHLYTRKTDGVCVSATFRARCCMGDYFICKWLWHHQQDERNKLKEANVPHALLFNSSINANLYCPGTSSLLFSTSMPHTVASNFFS